MKVLITITKDINIFKIKMQKKSATASANFWRGLYVQTLNFVYYMASVCVSVCIGTSVLKP